MVLKHQEASESSGELAKTQITEPTLHYPVSDSVGLP